MEGKELMEAKLQAIEERLAHYEDLNNRGKLSQEDYEILISEGKKEAERVKEIGSVEPDEEHAEAREIWVDVQKQFAEGKLSKEEFEKYKKMFEHYQFDAPKIKPNSMTEELTFKDLQNFAIVASIVLGIGVAMKIMLRR